MSTIVIIVIIAIIILGVYLYFRQKRKNTSWQGVLENKEKKTTSDSEGYETDWYYLYITTDSGEKTSIRVSEKVYNQFAVGDKIVKRAGQMDPEKM